MNRSSMFPAGPKMTGRPFPMAAAAAAPTPGVRKPRSLSVAPGPASTRMYGKPDQTPAPGANMFGSASPNYGS